MSRTGRPVASKNVLLANFADAPPNAFNPRPSSSSSADLSNDGLIQLSQSATGANKAASGKPGRTGEWDNRTVKHVHIRPTLGSAVLDYDSVGDHPCYFRPRPALDRDWFQMPKPPKLAYQREQFFANLLRKATQRPKMMRRPKTVEKTLEQPDTKAMTGGTVVAQKQPRLVGGFAGTKYTKTLEAGVARPGTSPGCMNFPAKRIVVPKLDTPLGKSTRKSKAPVVRYARRPQTSTIFLAPTDDELMAKTTEEEDLGEHNWREIQNMTDCHHRDLALMKSEIQGLNAEVRTFLEAT